MEISVAVPNGLVDVSNGRFQGKTDLGDGYTRWDWKVHYPINNYDVSLNIATTSTSPTARSTSTCCPRTRPRRKNNSPRPSKCCRSSANTSATTPFPSTVTN